MYTKTRSIFCFREGKQDVEWTPAIKRAMHEVQEKSEPSKRELHNQAKALNIQGRSKMNKDELVKAIRDAQS